MNSHQLSVHIGNGVRKLKTHPCSICAAGWYRYETEPHFHGSDIGKCRRLVHLERTGGTAPIDDPTKAMFLYDGHLHESSIVEALRHDGVQVDHRDDSTDGNCSDEMVIIATCDHTLRTYDIDKDDDANNIISDIRPVDEHIAVVAHTDGVIDGKYLLECKAVKDTSFSRFRTGGIPEHYRLQAGLYITALKLEKGFLVAKNRYTSEWLVFEIERNDELIWQKLDELFAVHRNIVSRVLTPPSHNTSDDFECRFCARRLLCWY